jgi:hypothetical protein
MAGAAVHFISKNRKKELLSEKKDERQTKNSYQINGLKGVKFFQNDTSHQRKQKP